MWIPRALCPARPMTLQAASVRLPVWLLPMPMLPPQRWLCWLARPSALFTPLWLLPICALPWLAAVSALEPSAAVSVLYKEEIDASDNIIAATNAKAAAYTAEVCSAANAVACGAADLTCDAANVRASVVAALELLSTKRAARLPKKHGNMAL